MAFPPKTPAAVAKKPMQAPKKNLGKKSFENLKGLKAKGATPAMKMPKGMK